VIPSNDDASKSIDKILSYVTESIAEGLANRKASKEQEVASKEKEVAVKEKEVIAKEETATPTPAK
jgi:small subunit ribosomal protein S2